MQAEIRFVTSKADSGPGSFREVMTAQYEGNPVLQSGDTIKFADELANDTIEVLSSFFAFGGADITKFNGKNLIVLGNGVTMPGNPYFGDGTGQNVFDTLRVENIHFITDYKISFFARVGHVRNCSFINTDASTTNVQIRPAKGNITFEGCAFVTGSSTYRQLYLTSTSPHCTNVSFISCTFVKPKNSYSYRSTSYFSFNNTTLRDAK